MDAIASAGVSCGVFAEGGGFPGAEWVEVMLDPFSFTGYQSIIVSEIEGTFCHLLLNYPFNFEC